METEIVQKIPVLSVKAGPLDSNWEERFKEELAALVQYIQLNQEEDNDWFSVDCDEAGVNWTGKCFYIYNYEKYEFDLNFEIPASYPDSPIELCLPELDGKTPKMYRGGKICLDIHFSPLWKSNTPKFGIAHALALAVKT